MRRARAQAADAVCGGDHLPGGGLHPGARARPQVQPQRGRADRAVLQHRHQRVALPQRELIQIRP